MRYSKKVQRKRIKEKKEKQPKRGSHASKWEEHIRHIYDLQEIRGYINQVIWMDHGGDRRTYERIKQFIRHRTLIPTENKNIHGQIKDYKFRLLINDEKELEKHFSIIKMLRDRDKK